jgi:hypothetical protein
MLIVLITPPPVCEEGRREYAMYDKFLLSCRVHRSYYTFVYENCLAALLSTWLFTTSYWYHPMKLFLLSVLCIFYAIIAKFTTTIVISRTTIASIFSEPPFDYLFIFRSHTSKISDMASFVIP